MAAAEPGKTRTVADIMSRPVVDGEPARQGGRGRRHHARAPRRVGRRRRRAPARRASSPSATSCGSPPPVATPAPRSCSEWMTADPDSVAPDVDVVAAFASLSEHGYRHIPVVDARRARRHRVDARPDAHRADPAGRAPRARDPARARGRGRRRDRRSATCAASRASTTTASTPPSTSPRQRSLEDVWHLMFEGTLPSLAERAAFAAEVAPLRAIPAPVPRVLPAIARLGASAPPLDMLRTTRLAARRGPRLPAVARRRRRRAAGTTRCASARSCPRCSPRSTGSSTGSSRSSPDPELAYAANYLYMLTRRRCPSPTTPAPSSST